MGKSLMFNWIAPDVITYYFYIAKDVFSGLLPYKDFNLEYPPLNLILFLIPKFFAQDPKVYYQAYASLMLLFYGIFLFLLWNFWEKKKGKTFSNIVILVGSSILLLPLVFDHFDFFPAFLSFISLIFLIKKRLWLSFVFLGLSASSKIYPFIFLPFFLIFLKKNQTENKKLLNLLVVFLISFILPFLPFVLLGSTNSLNFISYHLKRPVEFESFQANIIFLFDFFNLAKARTFFAFNSFNVELVTKVFYGNILATSSFAFFIISYAFLVFRFIKIKGKFLDHGLLLKFLITSLLVLMMTNKVFSPQYILWPWPLILLLLPFITKKDQVWSGLIFILMTFFTYLELSTLTRTLAFQFPGLLFLTSRNLLLFLLFLFFFRLAKIGSSGKIDLRLKDS